MPDAQKNLLFVISASVKDFNAAMGDIDRQAKNTFGNIQKALGGLLPAVTMTGVVAAVAVGFEQMMTKAAQFGEDISLLKTKTGMSSEYLQNLGFAARTSGTDLSGLAVGVKFMQKNLDEAAQGVPAAVELFKRLGLSWQELKGMCVDEQFTRISRALGGIQDPGERAALTVKLLGRSGTDLLPLITDLDALIEKAKRLHIALSDKDLQTLQKGKDATEALGLQWEMLSNKFAATAWPSVTQFLDALSQAAGAVDMLRDKWIKLNNELQTWMDQFRPDAFKLNLGSSDWGNVAPPGNIKLTAKLPDILLESWRGSGDAEAAKEAAKKKVVALASGGIVTSPQLAMVGDSGPEAIVPLGKMGGDTYNISLSAGAFMGNEAEANRFIALITDGIRRQNRVRNGRVAV